MGDHQVEGEGEQVQQRDADLQSLVVNRPLPPSVLRSVHVLLSVGDTVDGAGEGDGRQAVEHLAASLGDPGVRRLEVGGGGDLERHDQVEEREAGEEALAELEHGGDGGADADAQLLHVAVGGEARDV